jgi:hypothetical protein
VFANHSATPPGTDVEDKMSLPDDQGVSLAEDASAPVPAPMAEPAEATADRVETSSSVEDILRVRLSEELDAALESPDPVAGLDKAVQTVAMN